jgi:hypothetical protein
MTELHVIHQACRDCVFADYDNRPDAKPCQVGCLAKRLDVYRERGEVVEAYDDQCEFDIVNGSVCTFFRDKNTLWAMERDQKDYLAQARKEVTIKIDAIILCEKGFGLDELKHTLDAIREQQTPFGSVYVVKNCETVRIGVLHAFMRKHGGGLNWNITDVLGEPKTAHTAVDEITPKLKGQFYAVMTAGACPQKTFVSDIDVFVTEKMERFFIALADDVIVVQTHFHKKQGGNQPGVMQDTRQEPPTEMPVNNIVDKAKYVAEMYNAPQMVRELCHILS